MTNRGRHICLVALWGLVASAPLSAFGQVERVRSFKRPMPIDVIGGQVVMSAEFPEVFGRKFKRKLASGFTSRLLISVRLKAAGKSKPVASRLVVFTILYDIWDELFAVREEGLGRRRDLQLGSLEEVMRHCGALRKMPLAALGQLRAGQRYQVDLRIEVNPTSPEQRRKVREYLANPDGGGAQLGAPRSFFGSFSKIFVSEKDIRADAVLKYRSEKFSRPGD